MATIEAVLTVGQNRELTARTTTDREKLSKLKPGEEVRVKIATGGRSLSSNALSHQWYKDASMQMDESPEEVRAYCKLHFGVPLMLAESEKFRESYNAIRYALTYESKLKAMDILDVTSLMSKDQMCKYLNDMQRSYAEQGVILETPKDSAYAKWIEQEARKST